MSRGPLHATRRFLGDRRAVSAIEFALILPVFLAIMAGGIQLITYVNASRKIDLIASSISQMIAQTAPPQGSTIATVNSLDLHFSFDAALVLFPYLMTDAPQQNLEWWQDISINFASIVFTPKILTCLTNSDPTVCYQANVAWTSTGTAGGNYRPCAIPQSPAADAAAPSRTSLPRSVFGPDSIIAVDVVFLFRPTFGATFIAPVRIARSIYLQPRYATQIKYDITNDDGIAVKCPGFL
ncbi:TadE/TadG family type IV pilus assembly protein [Methylobacterium sp. Leaf100]|uniref:TadE/TadG family type IV pilus assembly protein n=1 Tax=Methylobacterium sp. Leaf100 TaxID=1736252 RepID=UPI0006FD0F8C|nr:TadE/TadG family type IV pilus assembly protein [Methylobacterium sp. Leaf100]KQP30684.1 pilus assembly protein TadE [Methylobacterium sp. Leaf100]